MAVSHPCISFVKVLLWKLKVDDFGWIYPTSSNSFLWREFKKLQLPASCTQCALSSHKSIQHHMLSGLNFYALNKSWGGGIILSLNKARTQTLFKKNTHTHRGKLSSASADLLHFLFTSIVLIVLFITFLSLKNEWNALVAFCFSATPLCKVLYV